MNVVSEECAKTSPDVAEYNLPGTYRGPDGMRITLGRRVQVKNWPYDLSIGEDDERRFDGQGSWSYDTGTVVPGEEEFGIVELSFSQGSHKGDMPRGSQELLVGGAPAAPVLFHQVDPDNCPDPVFRQ
ncbi:hypothetical protein [Streptomyces sp. ME19-01-6]|uniref:hypothetical protein n=1 Tax=Streptomyces sp. ME19-01-6 TaxID=3028686 RepID=UPI0029BBF430|nr:hypothetical protein [Streptomyces sp. ME19-01-6]MDX3227847.1 hypothetical protein [Streptomyces sp. ME19-01-6]